MEIHPGSHQLQPPQVCRPWHAMPLPPSPSAVAPTFFSGTTVTPFASPLPSTWAGRCDGTRHKLNERDVERWEKMRFACRKRDKPMLRKLAQQVPPNTRHTLFNKRDAVGTSLLFVCADESDVSLSHFLLANGADPDAANVSDEVPLHKVTP